MIDDEVNHGLAIASRARLVRKIVERADGRLMKVSGQTAFVEVPDKFAANLVSLWAKHGFSPCLRESRLVTAPGERPKKVCFYIVDLKPIEKSAGPIVEIKRRKQITAPTRPFGG